MALISYLRQACRTMMQILVSMTWMAPLSIPFIGARIQGYVPQQSPDVLQHVVPESALGWSYKVVI